MRQKFNPHDIIMLTKDIAAQANTNSKSSGRKLVNITLPTGTLLLSNTHNHINCLELSMVPQNSKKLDTILNLYAQNTMDKVWVVDLKISTNDLEENYEIIERKDYKKLDPGSIADIYLLAYLFLDGEIKAVSEERILCFVADKMPIECIAADYDDDKLTHKEASDKMVGYIKEQIKNRQR
jgi:hypothetical protein